MIECMYEWIIGWMDEYKDKNEEMDVWKYEWMKENREKGNSTVLLLDTSKTWVNYVGL
jgi:hypothetical protein